jgi:hypothetical protein
LPPRYIALGAFEASESKGEREREREIGEEV